MMSLVNDYSSLERHEGLLESLLGVALAGFLIFSAALIVIYVVSSIFLMFLLKNARHNHPWSAWIPLWSYVSIMQIAGIRGPWYWLLITASLSIAADAVPIVGGFFYVGFLALYIFLAVYVAKAIQKGVGSGGTGAIVLAVLFPLAWFIWMGIASDKIRYDRESALYVGSTFPLRWFQKGDPRVAFKPEPLYHSQPRQSSGFAQRQPWDSPNSANTEDDRQNNRGSAQEA